jgi:hypothetical protein
MKVLLVNSRVFECGVYQYGKRLSDILKTESRYKFLYLEVDNAQEFNDITTTYDPDIIIYNRHDSTLPWLTPQITHNIHNKSQYFIYHEGSLPAGFCLDGYLATDMSSDPKNKIYPLIRPIFEVNFDKPTNKIPIIGSFGFGFHNKGFQKICKMVSETFEEAVVRLHITNPFFGDYGGNTTNDIIQQCMSNVTNPKITIEVTTDFLPDEDILKFLNSNSLNVFLYDYMYGRGLSSVIDYAVSVNTPLAVNSSYMFRHIISETPNINIESNNSLKQIMDGGVNSIMLYRDKWSHSNLKNSLYSTLTRL